MNGVLTDEFGAPLVEGGATHAALSTRLWHWDTGFGLFQNSQDLAAGKRRLLHAESPLGIDYEKTLLMSSLN